MPVRRISVIAAFLFVIASICAKDDAKEEPAAKVEDALPKGATARFATPTQRRARVSSGGILDIAYSKDGDEILTLGIGDMHRWNSSTFDLMERLQYRGKLHPDVISPAKGHLLGTPLSNDSFGAIDMLTGDVVYSIATKEACNPETVSPNGETLLTTTLDGPVKAWHLQDGKLLATIPNARASFRPIFAPDNKSFFVDVEKLPPSYTLHQIELTSGQSIKEFRNSGNSPWTQAAIVSPDNRRLLGVLMHHKVCAFEIATGKAVSHVNVKWQKDTGVDHVIAISPDGRLLATANYGGIKCVNVIVWDARRMKVLTEWHIDRDAFKVLLTFSPDSSKLLTVTDEVLVWDVSGLLKPPLNPQAKIDGEQFWKDLGGDAETGFKAIAEALDTPKSSVEFLKSKLQPTQKVDAEKLKPLEVVRQDRALEILEAIGTPAAKKLMEELASGEPTAKLTQDAKAGVERLQRREAAKAPPG